MDEEFDPFDNRNFDPCLFKVTIPIAKDNFRFSKNMGTFACDCLFYAITSDARCVFTVVYR